MMIREKKLNKLFGNCLACNEYSECEITERKRTMHLFFVAIHYYENTYRFNWRKCNHCIELVRKEDIKRYKEEQVDTKSYLIPYYSGMTVGVYASPKELSTPTLVLIVGTITIIALLLGILLAMSGLKLPWWLI